MTKKQKKMLARILVCAVMLIALQFLPITGIPRFALYLAAYLVIGFDILKKAAKGIGNGGGGWLEFDYVPEEHEVRAGHPDYTGRLCVIGAELKEDGLAELFGV